MKTMTKKKFKSRPTLFFEIYEKSQKMIAYKNAYKNCVQKCVQIWDVCGETLILKKWLRTKIEPKRTNFVQKCLTKIFLRGLVELSFFIAGPTCQVLLFHMWTSSSLWACLLHLRGHVFACRFSSAGPLPWGRGRGTDRGVLDPWAKPAIPHVTIHRWHAAQHSNTHTTFKQHET